MTPPLATPLFTPPLRQRLREFADQLIPTAPGAASASDAGIGDALLDRVVAVAPERAELLLQVLREHAGQTPPEALAALRRDDPQRFDLFCETVAGAYFMSPLVRAQIAYPGRDPVPARSDIADMEELLTVVYEAGFAPRAV